MNDIVVSSEKQFGRAILGLNKNEVYAYLNQISGAYEELQLQIQVLKEQNDKLSDSNRENALKLYNLQNDITESQRKYDRANVELEAAKKESRALRKELDAAERRIQTLTDELIKAGGEGTIRDASTESQAEPMYKEAVKTEPVMETPVQEEPKEETPKSGGIKDIFADLRREAAQEKKEEEAKAQKPEPTVIFEAEEPMISEDGEEVYAGEVEIKVDESMLIGNDDDEDEGFNFL